MRKLMDVCELIVDCPHTTAPDEGAGYPLIRTPNIGKGRLILDNVHRVCKEVYDARNARAIPQADDIILAREAPAGNVALIQKGQEVCLGQRTVLIRADKEKVNPAYLTYYLLAPKQQHDLKSSANGATVGHINMPRIRGLKVDLPVLSIQRKIAEILSAYDNLIDNYRRQIKLLEEAAQRLYKEWFVNLHFPGYEHTKIVDGVPEGWERKRLTDVFDYVRGKSYTSKELSDTSGVLMVTLKNIQAFGGYNRYAEKRFSGTFKARQTLSAGDVVMGVTDMTNERRLVGHVALVPNLGEATIFSMDLIKLVPKLTDNIFIYSALHYGRISNSISQLANGTNVLHLKPEAISRIDMLIPTGKIVLLYRQYASSYLLRIELLQNQITLLTEARDRMLPKLMSGEIKV